MSTYPVQEPNEFWGWCEIESATMSTLLCKVTGMKTTHRMMKSLLQSLRSIRTKKRWEALSPPFFIPNFKAMDLFSPPKDTVKPFSIEAENQICRHLRRCTAKRSAFVVRFLNMLRAVSGSNGYYKTLPEIKSFVASYWQSIQ